MKHTTQFLIAIASFLSAGSVYAQGLQPQKAPFDFVTSGSLLIIQSTSGKNLATIDLDKPEFKNKVIAFTYSAKKQRPASAVENQLNTVTIFPNPAVNQVNLQFKGSWKYPVEVQIFDKNGNALQANTLESTEQPLGIGSLSQGIYILKAQSGNASATEKLVVQ